MGIPAKIETIAILTCDRPEALATAAESYLANATAHGRKPALLACDDSRKPESAAANLEVLKKLRKRFGVPIRYSGTAEKRNFIGELAGESQVPAALVEYGLQDPHRIGYTPGANHNFTLLSTIGQLIMSADDDTLCEPRGTAGDFETFARTQLMDPTQVEPAESVEAARALAPPLELDVLGAFERWLGRKLKDESMVRMCLPGLLGDSGWRSPFYLFELEGKPYRAFVRDASAYRRMVESRQIMRRVEKLTVTRSAFCQTAFVALDNRHLLPPFFPALRGQDFIFSRVLALGLPGSATAYYPFCLMHVPPEKRVYSPQDHKLAAERKNIIFPFATILKDVLRPDRGARGLEGLGRALRNHASSKEFPESIRQGQKLENESRAKAYEKSLAENPGAPAYWKNDVSVLASTYAALAENGEYHPPEELEKFGDGALDLFQRILADYGALLEAWPALIAATKRLRERGVTPARELS